MYMYSLHVRLLVWSFARLMCGRSLIVRLYVGRGLAAVFAIPLNHDPSTRSCVNKANKREVVSSWHVQPTYSPRTRRQCWRPN